MALPAATTMNQARLDYLDAVRAFALILGIVFHASLSFLPFFIGWAVMDISTSQWIGMFMLVSHSFRMPLFFLLAGFFSHMTLQKRGVKAFVSSRFMRIAVPFLVAWFLLRPLLVSGWVMGGASLQGDVDIWAGLSQGFASLLELPKDLLVGTHLWFLYYLLLVSVAVVVLKQIINLHPPSKNKLGRLADQLTSWLCQSRLAIGVLAVATTVCLWFMDTWGLDTPDKSLTPHLPILLVYGGFFVFGCLLHRQTPLIDQLAKVTWGKVVLCILAIVAATILSSFQMQFGHPNYDLLKAGFVACYAVMMWTLVAISIGLFKRFFSQPNNIVRYIADASYWLYLIHLPIVVWLQVAFAELPIHWSLKLVSICGITITFSLVVYDLLVRPTLIGKTLNGKTKPSALLNVLGNSRQAQHS